MPIRFNSFLDRYNTCAATRALKLYIVVISIASMRYERSYFGVLGSETYSKSDGLYGAHISTAHLDASILGCHDHDNVFGTKSLIFARYDLETDEWRFYTLCLRCQNRKGATLACF